MWFRVLGQQIWPRIGFLAEDLEGRTLSFQIPHGLKRFDLLLVAGCGFKDPVEAFRLLDRSGSLVKTSKTPRFENFSVPLQRTPTTKERLFACGRSYPTSRCQNPQAWMWWLNMWIRAPVQMVTFVFSPCQGQSLNDIDVISATPKVVWCKRYSEEMWFVSPQPFIRTCCERFNKLVTGGVFQATASKGALAVSWFTYWRQGLMLSWSGMWGWDWIDHLEHLDVIFKHD